MSDQKKSSNQAAVKNTTENKLVMEKAELQLAISLGDMDSIFPDIREFEGVAQRLFALGYLYEDYKKVSKTVGSQTTVGELAWNCFKKVNKLSSNESAQLELQRQIRESIVVSGGFDANGVSAIVTSRLPAEGEFSRIRVPGGFLVPDEHAAGGLYGSRELVVPHRRIVYEQRIYDIYHCCLFVPIVVTVSDSNGAPVVDREVILSLEQPDAAAAGEHALFQDKGRDYPHATTDSIQSFPGKFIEEWQKSRRQHVDIGRDPQCYNAYRQNAGKRGNIVVGNSSSDNVFFSNPREQEATEASKETTRKLPKSIREYSAEPVGTNAIKLRTDQSGVARFYFMPSHIGGDRYKFKATATGLTKPVKNYTIKTGTIVVWRILRLHEWFRWDYPRDTSEEAKKACHGALPAIDWELFAQTLRHCFLEVRCDPAVYSGPTVVSEQERQKAIDHAKSVFAELAPYYWPFSATLRAQLPKFVEANFTVKEREESRLFKKKHTYRLAELLDHIFPTAIGVGFIKVDTQAYRSAFEKLCASLAAIHLEADPLDNNEHWKILSGLIDVVQAGVFDYFSRNFPGSFAILQVPAYNSLALDNGSRPDVKREYYRSGLSGMRRGIFLAYGVLGYFKDNKQTERLRAHNPTENILHELGHLFYLQHQQEDSFAHEHDPHDVCISGYTSTAAGTDSSSGHPYVIDFCGYCALDLAGYNTSDIYAVMRKPNAKIVRFVGKVVGNSSNASLSNIIERRGYLGKEMVTCYKTDTGDSRQEGLELGEFVGKLVSVGGIDRRTPKQVYLAQQYQLLRLMSQEMIGTKRYFTAQNVTQDQVLDCKVAVDLMEIDINKAPLVSGLLQVSTNGLADLQEPYLHRDPL